MTKEEALDEFLKSLKVTFNNASAYFKEHPYFLKSVDTFYQKTQELLLFLNPIKIVFGVDVMFVEGKILPKNPLYSELITVFHLRKIKSLEIRMGVNSAELIVFLSKISLPPRELLRAGGLQKLLANERIEHIISQELDYSQLLKAEGDECKDVWIYLFKDALARNDATKIIELADKFEMILSKFRVKDLFEDKELNKSIKDFMEYLKEKEIDKLNKCANGILKLILKEKDLVQKYKIEEVRGLLKDFDGNMLSNALWDRLAKDDDFDALSFNLFSQLIGQEKHKSVASLLANKMKGEDNTGNDVRARKRVQELFFVPEERSIPEVYRQALSFVLKKEDFENKYTLYEEKIDLSYHYILLNLFAAEGDKEKLSVVLKKLSAEFEKLAKNEDFEYIGNLFEVIKNRKIKDPAFNDLFQDLENAINNFIENQVFKDQVSDDLLFFLEALPRSSFGPQVYIQKIFEEGKINAYILKLFFHFFPQEENVFLKKLDEKHSDLEFLERIMAVLIEVDAEESLVILKRIFYFANNLVKINVLKSMHDLSIYDKDFLFSVLRGSDTLLKKEALTTLAKDEFTKLEATKELFNISNTWGKNNRMLLENMAVVEEAELTEAKEYLVLFSNVWVPWKISLRKRAKEILKEWDERKS